MRRSRRQQRRRKQAPPVTKTRVRRIAAMSAWSISPGKVEVVEVFWLGCPHCYALEPFIQTWLKTKPAYIDFVRVPVMWGPVHRAHARLFYTLQALNRS